MASSGYAAGRPIGEQRLSPEMFSLKAAPEPGVHASVPVVAHNEKRVFRYFYGAVVIANVCLRGKRAFSVGELGIIFNKLFAVYVNLFVFNFKVVAGKTDASFDEVLLRVERVFENYDIAADGGCEL